MVSGTADSFSPVSTDLTPQRSWELASDLHRFDEPKLIELNGGIRISLTIEVQDKALGSKFHVVAELSGGLLGTGIGRLVARVLQSEVRKSVGNLAALR